MDQWSPVCPRCLACGRFVRAAIAPFAGEVLDEAIRTAQEVAASRSSYLALAGEVAEVVGALPVGPWSLGLYGPPGAGKSSLALLLSEALVKVDRPVLYSAIEEGFGTSMAEKLRRLEVRSSDIYLVCALSPGQLVGAVERTNARVVVIDSLTQSWLTPEDCARLQREANVSVVAILHVTKSGSPRGASSVLHWVDTLVRVGPEGWAREKCRYAPKAEGEVTWLTPSGN